MVPQIGIQIHSNWRRETSVLLLDHLTSPGIHFHLFLPLQIEGHPFLTKTFRYLKLRQVTLNRNLKLIQLADVRIHIQGGDVGVVQINDFFLRRSLRIWDLISLFIIEINSSSPNGSFPKSFRVSESNSELSAWPEFYFRSRFLWFRKPKSNSDGRRKQHTAHSSTARLLSVTVLCRLSDPAAKSSQRRVCLMSDMVR